MTQYRGMSKGLTLFNRGINIVCDIASQTYGPEGKPVITSIGNTLKASKDGYNTIQSIAGYLPHPEVRAGAKMIEEVCQKTNDIVGDGTTTTAIMTKNQIFSDRKGLGSGLSQRDMINGKKRAMLSVEKGLREQVRQITCTDPKKDGEPSIELIHVATISANNDQEIGTLVAKAFAIVGKEGKVTAEEAQTNTTEMIVVEGMSFDRGYISPYFLTNAEKQKVELEQPYIMIFNDKISTSLSIFEILEAVAQTGKSLLIIAEDLEGEALATIVLNRMRGYMKVCAVKSPGFGERRNDMLQDIAIVTGGKVITQQNNGDSLQDLRNRYANGQDKEGMRKEILEQYLGSAGSVIVTKNDCTIVDGKGEKAKIKKHCDVLREQISESSGYEKEKLQERLAKLTGGVALIKIGGSTTMEIKEKKDRIEDACCAVRNALEEGILPGCGAAFVYCLNELMQLSKETQNHGERAGINSIIKTILAPMTTLLETIDITPGTVIDQLLKINDRTKTCNILSGGAIVDAFSVGIIDSFPSYWQPLVHATSAANTVLETCGVIFEIDNNQKDNAKTMPAMEGYDDLDGMY